MKDERKIDDKDLAEVSGGTGLTDVAGGTGSSGTGGTTQKEGPGGGGSAADEPDNQAPGGGLQDLGD